MLSDSAAIATIAVRDLDRAKAFYADTLGFSVLDANSEVLTFKAGSGKMFVYRSEFGGSNRATSATFEAKDVAAEAAKLKARGVTFEHYDNLEGLTLQGDVYVGGGMAVAWFQDPDGNVLSIVSD
jgi:catechol 2,3-dioxygenase-like lactoylglutathione lyase family enzyme